MWTIVEDGRWPCGSKCDASQCPLFWIAKIKEKKKKKKKKNIGS